MSLPTTKATQSSIKSFFQAPKVPKYAPPPSQASSKQTPSPPTQPLAPPPQEAQTTAPTIPTPPRPTNIPPEATIRQIQEQDIPALRRINALLLPVAFTDSLYQSALDSHTSGPFSRVITWAHDGHEAKVIGSIVTILEPALLSQGPATSAGDGSGRVPQNLYIRSLGLLSPYRSLGLANAALDHVIASAMSASHLDVRTVTAHVWTENEEGLHWYQSRGFQRERNPIEGYYLKLRPGSAWLVHRPIQASVSTSLPSAAGTASAARQPAPSATAAIVNLPPMSSSGTPPPPLQARGQSYQNQRSETEWNDLPAEMMGPALLGPPGRKLVNGNGIGSEPGSSGSSRSSSVTGMKKKRDRSYPAAAFGS